MSNILMELDPKTQYETLDLLRDPEYSVEAMKLQCVLFKFLYLK